MKSINIKGRCITDGVKTCLVPADVDLPKDMDDIKMYDDHILIQYKNGVQEELSVDHPIGDLFNNVDAWFDQYIDEDRQGDELAIEAMKEEDFQNSLQQYAAMTLAEKRELYKAEVSNASEHQLDQLTAGYSQSEINSFIKQEQEARAWQADKLAPTPLLSAIANARGIQFDVLVAKVIKKSDTFTIASGAVFGAKQKKIEQLDAATTVEQLESIAGELNPFTKRP